MDRKQFFKEAFCRSVDLLEKTKLGKMLELDSSSTSRQRPPGAHPDDKQFLKLCTGCDACMAACPVHIVLIDDLQRRDPVIYPETGPCIHCPGTPCVTACPTGALKRSRVDFKR